MTGVIPYRLDSPSGPVIASTPVGNTGEWQSWTSRAVTLTGQATGTHGLYLVFTGSTPSDFLNINWFPVRPLSPAPNEPVIDT